MKQRGRHTASSKNIPSSAITTPLSLLRNVYTATLLALILLSFFTFIQLPNSLTGRAIQQFPQFQGLEAPLPEHLPVEPETLPQPSQEPTFLPGKEYLPRCGNKVLDTATGEQCDARTSIQANRQCTLYAKFQAQEQQRQQTFTEVMVEELVCNAQTCQCVPPQECDIDNDGVQGTYCAGTDCDDSNKNVYPNALEINDNKDNNCNEEIDEGYCQQYLCGTAQQCPGTATKTAETIGTSDVCCSTPCTQKKENNQCSQCGAGDFNICDFEECSNLGTLSNPCAFTPYTRSSNFIEKITGYLNPDYGTCTTTPKDEEDLQSPQSGLTAVIYTPAATDTMRIAYPKAGIPYTALFSAWDSTMPNGLPTQITWTVTDLSTTAVIGQYDTMIMAHSFTSPGNYRVDLFLQDPVGSSSASFTLTVNPFTGKELYVSSSQGNDANDCLSPQTPCMTLSAAYGKMSQDVQNKPDILYYFAGDQWTETAARLWLPSPSLHAVYDPSGTGQKPLITFTNLNSNGDSGFVLGSDWFGARGPGYSAIVKGLHLKYPTPWTANNLVHFQDYSQAYDLVIENGGFTAWDSDIKQGVVMQGSNISRPQRMGGGGVVEGAAILGNYFYDYGSSDTYDHGIYFFSLKPPAVQEHVLISGNTFDAGPPGGSTSQAPGNSNSGVKNTGHSKFEIVNNTFDENRMAVDLGTNYDDPGKNVVSSVIIERNIFKNGGYNQQGSGIATDILGGIISIRNNLFFNNAYGPQYGQGDIWAWKSCKDNPSYSCSATIYVEHNTFYSGTNGLANFHSTEQGQSANSFVIRNNVFYKTTGATGGFFHIIDLNLEKTRTVSNNNKFYWVGKNPTDDTFTLFQGNNPILDTSFQEWQSYGFDANSNWADPLFVNGPAYDFHLTSSSPAIDAGINLPTVYDDFDRVPRPQGLAWDTGAFEFVQGGGGSCPNNVCESWAGENCANCADCACTPGLTCYNNACMNCDNDNDGYQGPQCGGNDCNDNNPNINPGASEVCTDTLDNDCDQLIDCSDTECTCQPGFTCYQNACTNCDADADGYQGSQCNGNDCNDNDPTINPGASEVCSDSIDNNCNNAIDCNDPACSSDQYCQGAGCGNGRIDAGEECDDGNTNSGDGCSSSCRLEGLVGYWPFENNVLDLSGNGNNGLIGGNPLFVPGKMGTALDFDGTGDYVQVGTNGLLTSQGTLALWAKPEGFQTQPPEYLEGHTTSPAYNDRLQLYTDDSLGFLSAGIGDNHFAADNIFDMNTNTWYHIALAWSGTTFTVYVDGTLANQGTYTGLTTLNAFMDIGNNGYDGAESFNGILDEVRHYNRALTAQEIAGLAGSSSGSSTCGDSICDASSGETTCSCSLDCGVSCGDGCTGPGEQCDDANTNPADTCNNCQLTYCGDLIVQSPNGQSQNEECDDGNTNDADGCSATCQLEVCGNNRVDAGEECDGSAANTCNPGESCVPSGRLNQCMCEYPREGCTDYIESGLQCDGFAYYCPTSTDCAIQGLDNVCVNEKLFGKYACDYLESDTQTRSAIKRCVYKGDPGDLANDQCYGLATIGTTSYVCAVDSTGTLAWQDTSTILEVCNDGYDNNCDGQVDEDCVCDGIDDDGDGVENCKDLCNPSSPGATVNVYDGCPLPVLTEFDSSRSTDFSTLPRLDAIPSLTLVDAENDAELSFDPSYSSKPVSLVWYDPSTSMYAPYDLDSLLQMDPNLISLDPLLDAQFAGNPAVLTLHSLGFSVPEILKDGTPCSTCQTLSYTGGSLQFSVSGFSTYSAQESSSGGSGSGSSGGSGGGGGGGGGGRNSQTPTIDLDAQSSYFLTKIPKIGKIFVIYNGQLMSLAITPSLTSQAIEIHASPSGEEALLNLGTTTELNLEIGNTQPDIRVTLQAVDLSGLAFNIERITSETTTLERILEESAQQPQLTEEQQPVTIPSDEGYQPITQSQRKIPRGIINMIILVSAGVLLIFIVYQVRLLKKTEPKP